MSLFSPLSSDVTVIVVGHGSARDPATVMPTLRLVQCLSPLVEGARVIPAFMRGARGLAPVLEDLAPGTRVILLPHFSADGVFTRILIPEVVAVHGGHLRLTTLPPLGMAPGVADRIATALAQMALDGGGTPDLLVVAHGGAGQGPGTGRPLALAEDLRARGAARRAITVFLDGTPRLADWAGLGLGSRVVVACLFAGRGYHARVEIPAAFGLPPDSPLGDPEGLGPPLVLGDRRFRFLSPLGMPEAMAAVARDLLDAAEGRYPALRSGTCPMTDSESWPGSGSFA